MKITNERFNVQFCFIMKALGIKTIRQAQKFLDNADPALKIHDARVSRLRMELYAGMKDLK